MRPNEWIEQDQRDNAVATATRQGMAGKRHIIGTVLAGYDAQATGTLTVRVGGVVVLEYPIVNSDVLPLEFRGELDAAVSVELSASGVAGVKGMVAMLGYTEG